MCMTSVGGKRMYGENTTSAAKVKKLRLKHINSIGFVEIQSSHKRGVVWYYAKNLENFQNYSDFLNSIKSNLIQLLNSIVENQPIKS